MPRSSSVLTIAVGAMLTVPLAASAAPVPAATVGPAYLDAAVLQRLGLEVREDNAPRVVAVPEVRGVVAADTPGRSSAGPYLLRQFPGGVVLLGKNGWLYTGADLARLGSPEFRDDLGGRFGIVFGPFTSDGGMVGTSFSSAEGLRGLDPGLDERWSSPFTPGQVAPLSPPFAVAPGDRLYALGGSPSVVNALTGAVIVPVTGLPAQEPVRWAVGAPDGSARVLTVTADAAAPFLTRRATLHRVGTDGTVTWSRPVAAGPGALGLDVSGGTAGADGSTYLALATTNGSSRWDGRVIGVGPDGSVAWDTPVGEGPSRPAVDRAGNVWTATGGRVLAITPAGEVGFARTLGDRKQGGTVAAYGDGVLATVDGITVRLVARPIVVPAARRRAARLGHHPPAAAVPVRRAAGRTAEDLPVPHRPAPAAAHRGAGGRHRGDHGRPRGDDPGGLRPRPAAAAARPAHHPRAVRGEPGAALRAQRHAPGAVPRDRHAARRRPGQGVHAHHPGAPLHRRPGRPVTRRRRGS